MRRDSRNPNELDNTRKMIYLTGSVLGVTIIAFAITFAIYANKLNNETKISTLNTTRVTDLVPSSNNIDSESASSSIGRSVNEVENTTEVNTNSNTNTWVGEANENTTQNNTSNTNTNISENTNNTVESNKVEVKEEKEDPEFIKPVEGEIVKEYAKDNLVYSETLKEWTTHLGIDIKAEKTTVVKAASDGKIKAIKNDPRYGLTIIIEHTKGFSSVYSNLLTTEFVVIGEAVTQGQSIGTVGNTATFEIADDYHLHFEILKDNIPQDPKLFIQ